MSVAFIAIGDEVLRGETHEANGAALANRLQSRGTSLCEIRVVSDTSADIARAVGELCGRAKLVITSGGLGPTDDDGTRQAIATAANAPLYEDPELANGIRTRYERLGRQWIALNLRQAQIPTGARPLTNRFGTAPGFTLALKGARVAVLPGPPRECKGMLDDHLDDLLNEAQIASHPIVEHCLRVFGITESELQDRLNRLAGYNDVRIRSLPSFPEIRLQIRCAPDRADTAAHDFAEAASKHLGWRVFAHDRSSTFAQVVVDELRAHELTLSVAESCTGGLIGHMLTDVPGVSAVLLADFVTYANQTKRDLLGVQETTLEANGAVSEAVVRAMAEGAKQRTGADYAVATSGIAGPSGGSNEKPVGTVWFAVAGPAGTVAHHRFFPGLDRHRFKRFAAWAALALVRRTVLQTAA